MTARAAISPVYAAPVVVTGQITAYTVESARSHVLLTLAWGIHHAERRTRQRD